MKKGIEISVIVPIYNVEKYLHKCIDSILNQTFKKIEIILVDDGATDNCPKIVDEYAEKYPDIIIALHKENGGLGDARNYGINYASGEYLLFIDSDDYIEPDMLECLYNNIIDFDSDIVVCGFQSVTESGNTISVTKENLSEAKVMTLNDDKKLMMINPAAWNKIYKRELFLEHEDIRYPSRVWYEDIRTTLKLFNVAESITYVNKPLYNYLWREGSITNNKNCERNAEIIDAMNDIFSYFKSNDIYEEYKDELEYLTIFHVYLTASVRVLMIDTKHHLLDDFRGFLYENIPNWKKNKYLNELDSNKKLVLRLLNKKQYFLIKLIFTVKNQLKSKR